MADKLPDGFDWRAITPDDSPLTPMDVLADERHKVLGNADAREGGAAYNFTSEVYDYSDGTANATGSTFELFEAAKEAPVALVFGSYT